jgi:hypothetical protein
MPADMSRPAACPPRPGNQQQAPPLRGIGSLSAMRLAVTYGMLCWACHWVGNAVTSRELWNLAVISGTKFR